ncbi:hypothetical protein PSPO01_13918 [Paraphaeosphaeria sporulosa]
MAGWLHESSLNNGETSGEHASKQRQNELKKSPNIPNGLDEGRPAILGTKEEVPVTGAGGIYLKSSFLSAAGSQGSQEIHLQEPSLTYARSPFSSLDRFQTAAMAVTEIIVLSPRSTTKNTPYVRWMHRIARRWRVSTTLAATFQGRQHFRKIPGGEQYGLQSPPRTSSDGSSDPAPKSSAR